MWPFPDEFRNPAHTGANRCLPCTAVNLGLVAIVAAAVAAFAPPAAGAVVVFGVAAVWLRGYLVPGTPSLTRRYLPDAVLARFGKQPSTEVPTGDPAEKLVTLGVLASPDDAALSPSFRAAWGDAAAKLADDPRAVRAAAAGTVSVAPDAVALRASEGHLVLLVNGSWAGEWPSRTALVADLATARVLAGDGWSDLDRPTRADLAARIRGLAECCPVCEEPTRVSEDTVESCCRSADVVAVTCPGCRARIAEFDPAPSAFAPGA